MLSTIRSIKLLWARFARREDTVVGKVELYKDSAGKFRFRLKAGNDESIAAREAYNTKSRCGDRD